ncbi:MAG: AraC family transcriptional regulator [Clostridia bacterium]|nr:AraC family transcriptional regulator [Clostridia bacterium]
MNIINCIKSRKMLSFPPHKHNDTWEISIQIQGNIDVTIDDNKYHIQKNDIRVIPPGFSHFGISNELCTDIFLEASHLDFPDIVITHDYNGDILTLFEMLNKVMTEKENNYEAIAHSITNAICEYIKKYQKTDFKYDFTVNFKNTLYDNISNPDFNISDEIKKLGYTYDYFRRCFKEDFNKTPLEYLTELRIELGKKLLKQTAFQGVENVALQCGFKDIFYFSKAFKKHTGVSPNAYRKKV